MTPTPDVRATHVAEDMLTQVAFAATLVSSVTGGVRPPDLPEVTIGSVTATTGATGTGIGGVVLPLVTGPGASPAAETVTAETAETAAPPSASTAIFIPNVELGATPTVPPLPPTFTATPALPPVAPTTAILVPSVPPTFAPPTQVFSTPEPPTPVPATPVPPTPVPPTPIPPTGNCSRAGGRRLGKLPCARPRQCLCRPQQRVHRVPGVMAPRKSSRAAARAHTCR